MAVRPDFNADSRPNPDALLAQLREEEHAVMRGKLRIYFGASAGVGKTFAMLGAAQRAQLAGQHVLVGVVETHGRKDTMALQADLKLLPLRKVPHKGQVLLELDIDAALAAKPDVLVVDELAHTNAPGSRHPKRWQDVQELLDAGIDVWTALNVQHLESLNGTVGAITGVRVHETVPDTVLDSADEIVLVDVTADELLARLKAGKVYIPQQAERASQNFFRKGNLIALREIALRRTAEHVGDDVRTYRARHTQKTLGSHANGTPAWNTSGAMLVCVGPHEGAEHAVRSAARLAGQLNVRLHAAYVETPALQRRPATDRDRTLTVLKLAEELGASVAVLTGEDVPQALMQHAQTLNCATLVTGRPRDSRWGYFRRLVRPTMTRQLATLAPGIDLVEVGAAESVRKLSPVLPRQVEDDTDTNVWTEKWPRYAWAAAACLLTTALAFPLAQLFDLANIVMLFLLCVVVVAVKLGRGPSMLAAVLTVASFDFFFVQPRFSFAVSDVQYLLTFFVMLAVGLLIGQLTANLRFAAQVSATREQRARALFELTRDLSGALLTSQVVESAETLVRRTFGGDVRVLLPGADDQLTFGTHLPPSLEISVADWAFRKGQRAGAATATLPGSAWHFVPLQAPMRIRGVLALQPAKPRWLLIPEQIQQLETLARQIAIALERVHYVEVAQAAVVQMESERLRNTLLAAMSHDIRTPLTALVGQAEMLAASAPLTTTQRNAAHSIGNEARELSTLVTNMLEMARLESGQIELRKDWESVEEVVGSAIRASRHALGTLAVHTALPSDLPLVEFDAALLERVLVNLLENAAKYGVTTPAAEPAIVISATTSANALELRVRDFGPGLPVNLKGKDGDLFAKFTRGHSESSTRGVGLGLAICKAIMEAHRGGIAAAQADGGGAEFTLTLPRNPPPEVA
ncbi:MAG: two-component system sensor histidine kinase KdbD [Burkholderiales bacterium PBB4]|nr:MAG: two-component system sensor histidine kinase KdbD [Burkholderiales bacterium PBB4]